MRSTDMRAHLAEALRWSTEAEFTAMDAALAALAMAAPVLVGAVTGHLAAGLMAAVGAMGATATVEGPARAWLTAAIMAFGSVVAGAAAACLMAGGGVLAAAATVALAAAAALVGGLSRPLAVATTRFILFIVMVGATASAGHVGPADLLLLVAAGAAWGAASGLLVGAGLRRWSGAPEAAATAPASPTWTVRLLRWRRSLGQLSGWQYPLRLVACLAAAEAIGAVWPSHHPHWLAITVVILIERQLERVPLRTTQRALGAVGGVAIAAVLLLYQPPPWALVACVAVLAGARPLLRARNYLAYTAAMTPLIMLMLDAGHSPGAGTLADRVAATLVGAVLVLATNRIASRFSAAAP